MMIIIRIIFYYQCYNFIIVDGIINIGVTSINFILEIA